MQDLKDFIRECIIRQVQTTDAGKLLTAYNADAVDNLIKNIVGNLTMALAEFDMARLEEMGYEPR